MRASVQDDGHGDSDKVQLLASCFDVSRDCVPTFRVCCLQASTLNPFETRPGSFLAAEPHCDTHFITQFVANNHGKCCFFVLM
jgi:hypothetical protein